MIRRSEHSAQNKFAIVTRSLAQDKRLSFEARGLLLYVLSKPEGWEAKDSDLMKQGGIKKYAYASILKELKTVGYALRRETRKKGGEFAYSLEIYEEPQFMDSIESVQPSPDLPHTVEPLSDGPSTDNQVAHNNSTCVRATEPLITDQREVREIEPPTRQPKPRRSQIYAIPPDSMLELCDEDLAWCRELAPQVSDPIRVTLKWFTKQQANPGRGKDIEAWKASWRGYMMNYSDGEQNRNGQTNRTVGARSGNGREGVGTVSTFRPKRIIGRT